MVTARGLYWAADFGEIAEAEQFRIGAVDEDLYSAYFPIGQLQDLITVLTNTIPLGIGVLSLGTQVQARKVSTGFHTEVVIEPRSDTFPPQIMRVELTTLSDFISVLTSLQAMIAGQDPADWDGSKLRPISYEALPPELSPEALSGTIVSEALSARNGHKTVVLYAVIRNDGTGWAVLPIETNHRPSVYITSIETLTDLDGVNGFIRVHYESLGAAVTVYGSASVDETLASHNIFAGPSVNENYMDIRLSQAAREMSDYVYYDATAGEWVSQNGVFYDMTFDTGTGVWYGKHLAIPESSIYSASVQARGVAFSPRISLQSTPLAVDSVKVDMWKQTDEIQDYVSYNGSAWVSAAGVYTGATFTAGVLTLNHATIPSADSNFVGLEMRGSAYSASLSSASPAMSSTTVKIEFRDASGTLVTTPDTSMKLFVRRGRNSLQLATAPSVAMRMFVTHGGGARRIHPNDVNTTAFPSSNLWLKIAMEMPD